MFAANREERQYGPSLEGLAAAIREGPILAAERGWPPHPGQETRVRRTGGGAKSDLVCHKKVIFITKF